MVESVEVVISGREKIFASAMYIVFDSVSEFVLSCVWKVIKHIYVGNVYIF